MAYAEEMLPGSFELTVNSEQNISLTANDASLQAIVTELGAQLGVQVVGTLSDDRHVTTQLTDVTVGEVLRQIGDSYVLLSDAEDGKAKKIFLLGKGRDGQILDDEQSNLLVDPNSDTPQPGFQFEFDPSAAPIQEEETGQSESSPDHQ
ncbi:MAG: hypothetical protein GTO41_22275 [Burkholderiales bacterium]|nr:hypothetical protein [Burkholderiales bacterium]